MDRCVPYPLDWRFPYPTNCTRKILEKHLRDAAAYWRGWDKFPWYLTRTLHSQLDGAAADWDSLETYFWMLGYAAHAILNEKFQNRNAVMDMLIRHEVQFVGMFRHIVAAEIRWCLLHANRARLSDCALWGADTQENRQRVVQKRAVFQEGIGFAVAEFVRVLNYASALSDDALPIAGVPLIEWYRGAFLPKPGFVAVQVVEVNGAVHLAPDEDAWARFLSRQLPVPMIEMCPESEPAKGRASAPVALVPADRKEDEEEASRRIACQAIELATRLDGRSKCGKPTHAVVLGMYCVQNLTVRGIAKACGCSHTTALNRKLELERKLGMPLDAFRQYSGMLEQAAKATEDGRAKKINRRAAMA